MVSLQKRKIGVFALEINKTLPACLQYCYRERAQGLLRLWADVALAWAKSGHSVDAYDDLFQSISPPNGQTRLLFSDL